jgi:hypothetical protein
VIFKEECTACLHIFFDSQNTVVDMPDVNGLVFFHRAIASPRILSSR